MFKSKMVGNHHFTRIDTLELKELIFRKVGHQRAERYFDHLKRFLALRLSKSDFDRSCIQTIGRENISLHNKLILSILQNACQAKSPPLKPQKPEGINVKLPNGYQRNCMQSLHGDAFPQSSRRCRSPVNRDRKFRDRPSPLGPLGKSPSITCEETFTRTQEQQSATELQSIGSRPPVLEEGEEVEQVSESLDLRRWGLVTPPIGISVDSVVGGPRTDFHMSSDLRATCENSGGLPDTTSLKSRLEKKLATEGVGVSMESADLLNKGLDVFLKRLIEPCMGIAESRRRDSCIFRGGSNNNNNDNRMISRYNGVLLPGKFMRRESQEGTHVSMLDFRVAMESNSRLLGEDWCAQLEKICHYESS